jgi:hypothetical protein
MLELDGTLNHQVRPCAFLRSLNYVTLILS